MKEPESFSIRRYTRKELIAQYQCSERTFNRWVEQLKLGRPTGSFYSREQVRRLVDRFGEP
jgi:hypothetical protein